MKHKNVRQRVLMTASVASMIDQFNLPNIRLMQDIGYEVHVACNFKKGNTCGTKQIALLLKKLSDSNVICHQWDCPRKLWPASDCIRAYQQLSKMMEKYGFAWVHCHSPIGGALTRIAAHSHGIRVIYTAHGFHFYKGAAIGKWMLYYPAEKLLSYWTDVLLTVNKEDYWFAKRNLKAGEVCYIPGVGIDTQRFASEQFIDRQTVQEMKQKLCRKFKFPEDGIVLLSVGELSRRKNHKAVLSALAELSGKNICYLICGQGIMADQLMVQAQKLGIADKICMPGFIGDMTQVYQSADIFIFPSLQEGLPAALMEAMAAGLPCIVSDIRGNRELIEDGVGGRLFFPSDVHQIKTCILELLSDKQLRYRYGDYNKKKIAAYDWKMVKKRMQKAYAKMGRHLYGSIRISILIAVYNPNRKWLRQLFVSICRQSYQNFEVIVMDDCSDQVLFEDIQKTADACFGANQKVTLCRSRQNAGSDRTFEKLVRMAAGDFVAFCDQDDVWEDNKLELLVKAVQKEHAVMAYSDMSVMDEHGKRIYKSLRKMRKGLKYVHGRKQTAHYLADNCTAGCSMIARTDLVRKAMPFYRKTYCDQWIAACVSAHGNVAFVNQTLVRYRRHSRNQTGILADMNSRQDYYNNRMLSMYLLVQELERRDIHYPYEKEMQAFAAARKQKNMNQIWKYRYLNKKYAYFDLFMLCMPEMLAVKMLRMLQNGRRVRR